MAAIDRGRLLEVIDTIFAVSSGALPAAIAVVRVSGPGAGAVARTLAGRLPVPRRASLRWLRDADGAKLDQALLLWFPGPSSATGEDLLELHVHGGRAVVAAVQRAIADTGGTRRAEPGEFMRRALLNGRIDLSQAAGLADLLEAETERQRRAAIAAAEGAFGRDLRGWLTMLSDVRARLEATIDYDEDGGVESDTPAFQSALAALVADLDRRISAPTSERLRQGWRVVIAGPPNAGKSSLFNAMVGREAAIVAPVPGTTRDRIEASVVRGGQTFTLVDTAGLAEWTEDPIEQEGIRRSRAALVTADLVLWLGDTPPPGESGSSIWVRSRSDLPGKNDTGDRDIAVSALISSTIDHLWIAIADRLSQQLHGAEDYLLQETQTAALVDVRAEMLAALVEPDPLIQAEHLRRAMLSLSALLGVDPTEAMLDSLFARFCLGK